MGFGKKVWIRNEKKKTKHFFQFLIEVFTYVLLFKVINGGWISQHSHRFKLFESKFDYIILIYKFLLIVIYINRLYTVEIKYRVSQMRSSLTLLIILYMCICVYIHLRIYMCVYTYIFFNYIVQHSIY